MERLRAREKVSVGLFFIMIACWPAYTAYGQKIQKISIPDATVSTQINKQEIQKSTLPVSTVSVPDTSGTASSTISWQPQDTMLTAQTTQQNIQNVQTAVSTDLPLTSTASSMATNLKSPSDLKKLRIKVPNFEDRYKKLMEASIAKKLKRKKTLLEKISDEATEYGFFIIFGLVIITVIITLKMDKTKQKELLTVNAKPDEAEKKQDIWNDEF